MSKFFDSLVQIVRHPKPMSRLRSIIAGSFYRVSDIKADTSYADIKSLIDKMMFTICMMSVTVMCSSPFMSAYFLWNLELLSSPRM